MSLVTASFEQIVDKKMIKDYADIYSLKLDDLVSLERMGEKSAKNLIEAIKESKSRDLDHLICALGIQNIGSHTSEVLANHFHTLDKLMNTPVEELEELFEIGEIMAKNVVDFFSNNHTKDIINKLKVEGVNLNKIRKETKMVLNNIRNKSFAVTGTLNGYTRKEIEEKIKTLGGKVSSSISSKTDFLIAGESPGSKLDKAKELGTTILDKVEFEELIKGF